LIKNLCKSELTADVFFAYYKNSHKIMQILGLLLFFQQNIQTNPMREQRQGARPWARVWRFCGEKYNPLPLAGATRKTLCSGVAF